MASDRQDILCGFCRIPLEGPANPEPQDVFACPKCGNSDTVENVMSAAKAFVTEAAQHALNESLRKAARGSKFMKFEGKRVQKKAHRFITGHRF